MIPDHCHQPQPSATNAAFTGTSTADTVTGGYGVPMTEKQPKHLLTKLTVHIIFPYRNNH